MTKYVLCKNILICVFFNVFIPPMRFGVYHSSLLVYNSAASASIAVKVSKDSFLILQEAFLNAGIPTLIEENILGFFVSVCSLVLVMITYWLLIWWVFVFICKTDLAVLYFFLTNVSYVIIIFWSLFCNFCVHAYVCLLWFVFVVRSSEKIQWENLL